MPVPKNWPSSRSETARKWRWAAFRRRSDILLSTRRMNRYTDYDIANLTVGVECGVTLAEVQAKLAGEGRGYFMALDPPHTQEATVGGIVATNDSGPKRFLYGASRDFILGIKAVLPEWRYHCCGRKSGEERRRLRHDQNDDRLDGRPRESSARSPSGSPPGPTRRRRCCFPSTA